MNEADEVDVWRDYLGIACGGYDSLTDETMLAIVEMIGSKSQDSFLYDIANHLNLSTQYVALMQYVLASAKVDEAKVFTYGSSPAGLFVIDEKAYWKFLKALRIQVGSWKSTE